MPDFKKKCESLSSIDSRNIGQINQVLETHDWSSVSSDRTPVGLISRFTCIRCGDEYVAMLTSPRAMEPYDHLHSRLEVSADEVLIS